MPRSAADATRFTPTGPYAHSKPIATTIPLSTPPQNETPYEKVARLRAAANLAKQTQESGWDRVVARGRVWADRAHKFTALSLVGLTFGAGIIAAWSIGDMVLFNRRKRKVWFAEQEANYQRALSIAIQKEADGTLTDDLAMVLRNERAIEQYEQEQKEKGGVWKRTKETLFGGLAKQERRGGAMGIASEELKRITDDHALTPAPTPTTDSAPDTRMASSEAMRDAFAPDTSVRPVVPVIENARPQVSLRPITSPLDQYAENVASSLSQTWTNLFKRS